MGVTLFEHQNWSVILLLRCKLSMITRAEFQIPELSTVEPSGSA